VTRRSPTTGSRRASRAAGSLPARLRPFFWDHDFDALSWNRDRDLVIARLLTRGTWTAQNWLRAKLGDDALREWIVAHRGRSLSPRQLRFWQLILALPDDRVSAWIEGKRASVWFSRTRDAPPS
jgi:hypothetical protein